MLQNLIYLMTLVMGEVNKVIKQLVHHSTYLMFYKVDTQTGWGLPIYCRGDKENNNEHTMGVLG